MAEGNGWNKYELLVLQELKELRETCEKLETGQQDLKEQFIIAKTERGVARYFGGVILPAGVALAVSWIGRKLGF